MSHDPLCPAADGSDAYFCRCDEYAHVRVDERSKNPIAIGVEIARKARERALADAVEAVKGTEASNPSEGAYVFRSRAVAAIEALGGER